LLSIITHPHDFVFFPSALTFVHILDIRTPFNFNLPHRPSILRLQLFQIKRDYSDVFLITLSIQFMIEFSLCLLVLKLELQCTQPLDSFLETLLIGRPSGWTDPALAPVRIARSLCSQDEPRPRLHHPCSRPCRPPALRTANPTC